MILKRAVSGFTAGDLSFEADYTAKDTNFKRHCYAYVQQVGGQVVEWHDGDIDLQYANAFVRLQDIEFYVFYNSMYDYVAFSQNNHITGLEFMDVPALAVHFTEPFRVLTAAELNEPLRKQAKGDGYILLNENDLNEVELDLMVYFPAQTVGDIVFNYWD